METTDAVTSSVYTAASFWKQGKLLKYKLKLWKGGED